MPLVATDHLMIDTALHGPIGGKPVLLLHGWPDDASTWDEVWPTLAGAGFRVIVPTLRGFGDTRFVGDAEPRTGDSAVLATDAIALMDALGYERFMVAGHDWGANAAEALAVGWPDRVERLAMLSTPPRLGGVPTPSFDQAQRQWYHWFMATARGARAVDERREAFARVHWENWSPPGWFSEATFRRVSRAWENPDWAAVTIHSYRARWGEAAADPRSRWLADKVEATQTLSLPAIFIRGDSDGVNPPSASSDVRAKFTGPFAVIDLVGVGHFAQRENPRAVADHLLALFAGDPADLADTTDRSATARRAAPVIAGLAAVGLIAAAGVGFVQGRRKSGRGSDRQARSDA